MYFLIVRHKHFFLFFFLLLLINFPVFSQSKFGIRVGYNQTKFYNNHGLFILNPKGKNELLVNKFSFRSPYVGISAFHLISKKNHLLLNSTFSVQNISVLPYMQPEDFEISFNEDLKLKMLATTLYFGRSISNSFALRLGVNINLLMDFNTYGSAYSFGNYIGPYNDNFGVVVEPGLATSLSYKIRKFSIDFEYINGLPVKKIRLYVENIFMINLGISYFFYDKLPNH